MKCYFYSNRDLFISHKRSVRLPRTSADICTSDFIAIILRRNLKYPSALLSEKPQVRPRSLSRFKLQILKLQRHSQSLDRYHRAICNFVIHRADRNHSVDRREPGLYNCGIAMVHIRSYRHYIAARIERYRCLLAESHCTYLVHR